MSTLALTPAALTAIRRRLPIWFDRHRRDLPWRRSRDPYLIWVSEVMLQQTTVAAVVPRFEQFVMSFPKLADLAAADEHDVLRHWEGLGYYRRARHLHQAAQILMSEHGGRLRDDPEIWAALPGVGRYILGAVLSQAFDRPLPIVEANSQRVLCRLAGQIGDPKSGRTKRWLWGTAAALLPRKRAGDFNQALMELGALVCLPANPKCNACPLAGECVARRDGLQETIPVRSQKPGTTEIAEVAVVVRRHERVLLVQRPEQGRWASLWEFPHGERKPGETADAAAHRLLSELAGIRAKVGDELATLRHAIMHYRVTLVCMDAECRRGKFRSTFYAEGRWLKPSELSGYPVSSPQRRLAKAVMAGPRQRRLF